MKHSLLWVLLFFALSAGAQKPLALKVDGRDLVNTDGKKVLLQGVMDTPNPYFNSYRWGGSATDNNVQSCIYYFDKLFTAITNKSQGAYCNAFRLHLDPCWTNDPDKPQTGKDTGEANISQFSEARLEKYMGTLYTKLIKSALAHGLYVVVRPPGVCPQGIKVDGDYQKYLLKVWDIVSRDADIQANSGQVSLELANEPVEVYGADSTASPSALHDFFQPIVDKIRANGFDGIIWVPGSGWQSNYTGYRDYPITGDNIGYAVHDYVGWYDCTDDNADGDRLITSFANSVPVVTTSPVIITEIDWSPEDDSNGHYNEHGEWVPGNLGTWATGTTSRWGNAFKQLHDYYGNISMTLSGTGCYIDIDTYLNQGVVTPAFDGNPEACAQACFDWYKEWYEKQGDPSDSNCATALEAGSDEKEVMIGSQSKIELIATFKDGHTEDVAAQADYSVKGDDSCVSIVCGLITGLKQGKATVTATYTDAWGNVLTDDFDVNTTYFPWGEEYVKTDIWEQGTYDEETRTFHTGQWGQEGWVYDNGVDMSGYKYLVVLLDKPTSIYSNIHLYPQNSIWGKGYSQDFVYGETQLVVPLQTITYNSGSAEDGQPFDFKHVHIVSLWSNGEGEIDVNDIYLTNNDDFTPTGISRSVTGGGCTDGPVYNLQGIEVAHDSEEAAHLPKGIYIRNGKKFIVR